MQNPKSQISNPKSKNMVFRFFSVRIFLSMVMVLLLVGVTDAQRAKRDLERKRRRLLESMQSTKSVLVETQQEKRATERNYSAIQNKIEQREKKIDNLASVISTTSERVERNYEVINTLSNDITRIKADYGALVRKSFRQKLNYNLATFLFAADDFNQLIKRLHYLQQLNHFRKRQMHAILETRAELETQIITLERYMVRNADALANIEVQKKELDQKLDKEESKLGDLKHQEQRLRRDLNRQEHQYEKVTSAIDNIIRVEIEARARAARAAAEATRRMRSRPDRTKQEESIARIEGKKDAQREETVRLRETPEVRALSDNFRNNRGRLPWPVRNGVITRKFGRQPHPTLHHVMTSNNGIDIQTTDAAEVNAVFGGKVIAVQFIPGANYLVIVQHGSYYTVYSNLDKAYVKAGDNVALQQHVGRVSGNTVHFELWINRSRENPAKWIAKL